MTYYIYILFSPYIYIIYIYCEWAVTQCLCLYWSLTVIVYVLNSRIPKQRQRSLFPSMWERRASWATSRGWNKLVARGHQWTMNITELLPTVLSHPPCPVSSGHADVHWPRHWTQELKHLKDRQRCSNCALITLPLYKNCWPLIYISLGDCVLPDGDARTGFRVPVELDPRFIRPLNVFPCIRKSSHPDCMRLIRISPALRILS